MILNMVFAWLATAAAIGIAAPAGASCPGVGPFEALSIEALDARARALIKTSEAVLEVETLTAQAKGQPATAGVVRVIKGDYQPGQVLKAYRAATSRCGQGRIVPGERGLIAIGSASSPLHFDEYLPLNMIEALRRQGFLQRARGTERLAAELEARLPRPAPRERGKLAPIVAFQAEAGRLAERFQNDPYFSGYIFRDHPEPHAVIMFTGDAEARLRLYTNDPRYKAKSVDLTLAQLETMKDEMSRQLHGLGLRCSAIDGDEEHNAVAVVTSDLDRLKRAITEDRVKLPPKYRLLRGVCPRFP